MRALALVRALADDSMLGRRAGTPGAAKAAAFIAHLMAQAGLQPAGDSALGGGDPSQVRPVRDGDFYQFVTLKDPRDTTKAPVHSVNVIGYLQGVDTSVNIRSAYIYVVAHYDHLGIGQPVAGDSIYNGANDGASGTVAVLEIARQLAAGPRPRHSIVFIAFGAGEGGMANVQQAQYLQRNTRPPQAWLQIERIGRPDPHVGGVGHAWLTDAKWSTMGKMLVQAGLVVRDPNGSVIDPRAPHPALGDCLISFTQGGNIGHTLSSYSPQADDHQPGDEASRIDSKHLAAVINTAAKAVRLVANSGINGLLFTRGDNPLSPFPATDPSYPEP